MTPTSSTPQHTLTSFGDRPVIYFAGSIRAGRDDVPTYAALIEHLSSYGQVTTEHVGDYSLSVVGQAQLDDRHIHDRDLRWLRASDIVVAEVTTASLGVGYEIATAVAWRIPVVALHRGAAGTLSAMIAGSPGVATHHYSDLSEAFTVIDKALSNMTGRTTS